MDTIIKFTNRQLASVRFLHSFLIVASRRVVLTGRFYYSKYSEGPNGSTEITINYNPTCRYCDDISFHTALQAHCTYTPYTRMYICRDVFTVKRSNASKQRGPSTVDWLSRNIPEVRHAFRVSSGEKLEPRATAISHLYVPHLTSLRASPGVKLALPRI